MEHIKIRIESVMQGIMDVEQKEQLNAHDQEILSHLYSKLEQLDQQHESLKHP